MLLQPFITSSYISNPFCTCLEDMYLMAKAITFSDINMNQNMTFDGWINDINVLMLTWILIYPFITNLQNIDQHQVIKIVLIDFQRIKKDKK